MGEAASARRKAREAALQVLYAADATGRLDGPGIADVFDEVSDEFALPRRARERAETLCRGIARDLERVDAAIASATREWKLHRLASVDRNLLRIAAWELVCEAETPPEVIIDEAVEIARRFASETSPAFVNGVLDALWHGGGVRGEGA